MESPWRVATSKDGRKYYYNQETKATQWTPPTDFAGQELEEKADERAEEQDAPPDYTSLDSTNLSIGNYPKPEN